jgi:broad specificity phosphatase PhoE
MRLILIRHAERAPQPFPVIGEWNHTGPDLTENGRAQARRLAERLRASGEAADCTVFLSSPMPRACQTAEIVAEGLPVKTFVQDRQLCEMNAGEADGMPAAEYEARYGPFNPVYPPDRPIAAGGESWNMFTARVRGVHERLAEQYPGQTVVAVTHAHFLVVALITLLGVHSAGRGAWLDPAYTGITEWEWQAERKMWLLHRYNDIAHLRM